VAGMILAVPVAASIKVVLYALFPALTRPLPEETGVTPLPMDDAQPDRPGAPTVPAAAATASPPDSG
jgi:hypothetical protein